MARRSTATMPGEGRKPTTPAERRGIAQSCRRCPSRCSTGSTSVASATAGAARRSRRRLSMGLNGLPVAPHTGLRLFEPAPNSGTLVLPTTTGAGCAHARHHDVVPGRHEVAVERRAVGGEKVLGLLEVLDAGRQAVQQRQSSPRRTAASAALASWRARLTDIAVTALTAGFTSSMRSRQASEQFDRRNFLGADAAAQLDEPS